MTARAKATVLAALLALWFLAQSWRGMLVTFSEDDLMNMYQAWTLPISRLALGLLTPFTSVYRPTGSLFYRTVYDAFGLTPLPFRIAAYALMMLNIWLLFRLVRTLTGSSEIALLAALIGSFHKRLFGLYVNGGTIYDILSFTFFCLAFTYYIHQREQHRNVTGWSLLAFCALYSLALNSKEMAASLPPILLAYELIYHPVTVSLRSWLLNRIAIWATAAITLLSFKLKTAKGTSFYGIEDYARTFSLHQYFSTTSPLISQLFFLPETALTPILVVLIFAALLAFALIAKSKPLILATAIIILAPLPINFIPYRGFFVMYLPLIGWALYAATALVLIKDRIAPSQAPALIALTAAILLVIETRDNTPPFVDHPNMTLIRNLRADLLRITPSLPPDAKVAFLPGNPFPPDTWNTLYITRLLYKSPAIAVDRFLNPVDPAPYTLILAYRDGHYTNVR